MYKPQIEQSKDTEGRALLLIRPLYRLCSVGSEFHFPILEKLVEEQPRQSVNALQSFKPRATQPHTH